MPHVTCKLTHLGLILNTSPFLGLYGGTFQESNTSHAWMIHKLNTSHPWMIHEWNTSHPWAIHESNPKQLLIFKALQAGPTFTSRIHKSDDPESCDLRANERPYNKYYWEGTYK